MTRDPVAVAGYTAVAGGIAALAAALVAWETAPVGGEWAPYTRVLVALVAAGLAFAVVWFVGVLTIVVDQWRAPP